MTKFEQKQIARATLAGRDAMLRTLALIHRAASKRTQKEVDLLIESHNAWDQFTMVNGALLHNSEI